MTTFIFENLGDSFKEGNVSLPYLPPAALLEKENPYSPENKPLWAWDHSLYNQKYYAYWGPVPAIFSLMSDLCFGTKLNDARLVLMFMSLRIVFGVILLYAICKNLNIYTPQWVKVLSFLIFCFSAPALLLLARPFVYEVAIAGANCFLTGALASLFLAHIQVTKTTYKRCFLAFSGICFALAIGCRVSISFGVFLAVVTHILWNFVRRDNLLDNLNALGKKLLAELPLLLPIGLMMTGLLTYNFCRFDSIFDFGVQWQLTTFPAAAGVEYIPYNLASYLYRTPVLLNEFPWISQGFSAIQWDPGSLIPKPEYFFPGLPMVGMIYTLPFALFAAIPLSKKMHLLGVVCLALFAGNFIPLLLMFAQTTRYTADLFLPLFVLAFIGFQTKFHEYNSKPLKQKMTLGIYVLLSVLSLIVGILLPFWHENLIFHTFNPKLMEFIRSF